MEYVRILIQGVSEIGGRILDTCFMDRNKEETSHKHVTYCFPGMTA